MNRTALIAGLAFALVAGAAQAQQATSQLGDLPNLRTVPAGDTPDMWKAPDAATQPAMTPDAFESTLRNPFAFDTAKPLTAGYLVLGPVLGVASGAALLYVAGEIVPASGGAVAPVVVP